MTLVMIGRAMLMSCFCSSFGGLVERLRSSFARSRFLFWVMRRSGLLQIFKWNGVLHVVMRHRVMQDRVSSDSVMLDGKMRNNVMRGRNMWCHKRMSNGVMLDRHMSHSFVD